jgi:hypothetical protein
MHGADVSRLSGCRDSALGAREASVAIPSNDHLQCVVLTYGN